MDKRQLFDTVAELYDAVRPNYPAELIEQIMLLAKLNPNKHILEVGVGTGQISKAFAQQGVPLTGLELGKNLALIASKNLAAFPHVSIVNTAFETWQTTKQFDLFLSASAFHWVEPEFGLKRAYELLKPKAHLALVWHLEDSHETAFYKATTPFFKQFIPTDPTGPQPPAAHKQYKQALLESALFGNLKEHSISWQRTYSKLEFIGLLNTFSPNLTLPEEKRQTFNKHIETVIDDFGGTVTRVYKTILFFAQKL